MQAITGWCYWLVCCTMIMMFSCSDSTAAKEKSNKPKTDTLAEPDFTFNPLSPAQAAAYTDAIKNYYDKHLLGTGFNGAILVAKNGKVLFEDYHGYSNLNTKQPITQHTTFHLASISKTFTGMAVLKLWEENKLSLDDTLQKFFPGFPYHDVTIKNLLSHRSGLPNYLYFMDTIWDKHKEATNEDVINAMYVHKPPIEFRPDTHFSYCNTNFVLLASIIEKITHTPFPEYMKKTVFEPLGMTDTYIFSIKDTASYQPTWSVTKPFLMDQYDCTYGDKNVYSTVNDLFLWDKSLYEHTYLKKETLDMAFTPLSNEKRSMHNYGLAWRMLINNGDTLIYHNGKWHGSNTVFTRVIKDTATIIVLGNKLNTNIYQSKNIAAVFDKNFYEGKLEE